MVIFEKLVVCYREPMLNKIILEDLEHRCFQKSSSHPDTSSKKNHKNYVKIKLKIISFKNYVKKDIFKFRASFWKQFVLKRNQKLILVDNFINKNSDDLYVLQLCFLRFFDRTIKNSQKLQKTAKMEVFLQLLGILMVQ